MSILLVLLRDILKRLRDGGVQSIQTDPMIHVLFDHFIPGCTEQGDQFIFTASVISQQLVTKLRVPRLQDVSGQIRGPLWKTFHGNAIFCLVSECFQILGTISNDQNIFIPGFNNWTHSVNDCFHGVDIYTSSRCGTRINIVKSYVICIIIVPSLLVVAGISGSVGHFFLAANIDDTLLSVELAQITPSKSSARMRSELMNLAVFIPSITIKIKIY